MGRFYGPVGYGETVETAPGVADDVIKEKLYFGDVVRSSRRSDKGEGVNDNLRLTNSISIVADAFLENNFHNIRYIKYKGGYWKVSEIEEQRPRLIFRLGEVYNGPTPDPTPDAA